MQVFHGFFLFLLFIKTYRSRISDGMAQRQDASSPGPGKTPGVLAQDIVSKRNSFNCLKIHIICVFLNSAYYAATDRPGQPVGRVYRMSYAQIEDPPTSESSRVLDANVRTLGCLPMYTHAAAFFKLIGVARGRTMAEWQRLIRRDFRQCEEKIGNNHDRPRALLSHSCSDGAWRITAAT